MYSKRIVILRQTDSRFAVKGREICGVVKLESDARTQATVSVSNVDVSVFGEWWLLLAIGDKVFSHRMERLSGESFSLPLAQSDNIGCLLIKRQELAQEAACGCIGSAETLSLLRLKTAELTGDEVTPYEQFVAASQNFYQGNEVKKLREKADARYKSVEEYSSAFERYYAANSQDNYYDSVQREIGRVFLQFPPYYPLIRKYSQSFFVRIDFPSSEKYFVLGLLQQQGRVRYICYGLPAEKKDFSDKDFVFVENSPTPFWMLFQDAETGQITTLKQPV